MEDLDDVINRYTEPQRRGRQKSVDRRTKAGGKSGVTQPDQPPILPVIGQTAVMNPITKTDLFDPNRFAKELAGQPGMKGIGLNVVPSPSIGGKTVFEMQVRRGKDVGVLNMELGAPTIFSTSTGQTIPAPVLRGKQNDAILGFVQLKAKRVEGGIPEVSASLGSPIQTMSEYIPKAFDIYTSPQNRKDKKSFQSILRGLLSDSEPGKEAWERKNLIYSMARESEPESLQQMKQRSIAKFSVFEGFEGQSTFQASEALQQLEQNILSGTKTRANARLQSEGYLPASVNYTGYWIPMTQGGLNMGKMKHRSLIFGREEATPIDQHGREIPSQDISRYQHRAMGMVKPTIRSSVITPTGRDYYEQAIFTDSLSQMGDATVFSGNRLTDKPRQYQHRTVKTANITGNVMEFLSPDRPELKLYGDQNNYAAAHQSLHLARYGSDENPLMDLYSPAGATPHRIGDLSLRIPRYMDMQGRGITKEQMLTMQARGDGYHEITQDEILEKVEAGILPPEMNIDLVDEISNVQLAMDYRKDLGVTKYGKAGLKLGPREVEGAPFVRGTNVKGSRNLAINFAYNDPKNLPIQMEAALGRLTHSQQHSLLSDYAKTYNKRGASKEDMQKRAAILAYQKEISDARAAGAPGSYQMDLDRLGEAIGGVSTGHGTSQASTAVAWDIAKRVMQIETPLSEMDIAQNKRNLRDYRMGWAGQEFGAPIDTMTERASRQEVFNRASSWARDTGGSVRDYIRQQGFKRVPGQRGQYQRDYSLSGFTYPALSSAPKEYVGSGNLTLEEMMAFTARLPKTASILGISTDESQRGYFYNQVKDPTLLANRRLFQAHRMTEVSKEYGLDPVADKSVFNITPQNVNRLAQNQDLMSLLGKDKYTHDDIRGIEDILASEGYEKGQMIGSAGRYLPGASDMHRLTTMDLDKDNAFSDITNDFRSYSGALREMINMAQGGQETGAFQKYMSRVGKLFSSNTGASKSLTKAQRMRYNPKILADATLEGNQVVLGKGLFKNMIATELKNMDIPVNQENIVAYQKALLTGEDNEIAQMAMGKEGRGLLSQGGNLVLFGQRIPLQSSDKAGIKVFRASVDDLSPESDFTFRASPAVAAQQEGDEDLDPFNLMLGLAKKGKRFILGAFSGKGGSIDPEILQAEQEYLKELSVTSARQNELTYGVGADMQDPYAPADPTAMGGGIGGVLSAIKSQGKKVFGQKKASDAYDDAHRFASKAINVGLGYNYTRMLHSIGEGRGLDMTRQDAAGKRTAIYEQWLTGGSNVLPPSVSMYNTSTVKDDGSGGYKLQFKNPTMRWNQKGRGELTGDNDWVNFRIGKDSPQVLANALIRGAVQPNYQGALPHPSQIGVEFGITGERQSYLQQAVRKIYDKAPADGMTRKSPQWQQHMQEEVKNLLSEEFSGENVHNILQTPLVEAMVSRKEENQLLPQLEGNDAWNMLRSKIAPTHEKYKLMAGYAPSVEGLVKAASTGAGALTSAARSLLGPIGHKLSAMVGSSQVAAQAEQIAASLAQQQVQQAQQPVATVDEAAQIAASQAGGSVYQSPQGGQRVIPGGAGGGPPIPPGTTFSGTADAGDQGGGKGGGRKYTKQLGQAQRTLYTANLYEVYGQNMYEVDDARGMSLGKDKLLQGPNTIFGAYSDMMKRLMSDTGLSGREIRRQGEAVWSHTGVNLAEYQRDFGDMANLAQDTRVKANALLLDGSIDPTTKRLATMFSGSGVNETAPGRMLRSLSALSGKQRLSGQSDLPILRGQMLDFEAALTGEHQQLYASLTSGGSAQEIMAMVESDPAAAMMYKQYKGLMKGAGSEKAMKSIAGGAYPAMSKFGDVTRQLQPHQDFERVFGKAPTAEGQVDAMRRIEEASRKLERTWNELNETGKDLTKEQKAQLKVQEGLVKIEKARAEAYEHAGKIDHAVSPVYRKDKKGRSYIAGYDLDAGKLRGPEEVTAGKALLASQRTLRSLEKQQPYVRRQAGLEIEAEEQSEAVNMRRLLGGFGLMYMRSLMGIATSGWDKGYKESMAADEQLGIRASQATGVAILPRNYQRVAENALVNARGPAMRAWDEASAGALSSPLAVQAGSMLGPALGGYAFIQQLDMWNPNQKFGKKFGWGKDKSGVAQGIGFDGFATGASLALMAVGGAMDQIGRYRDVSGTAATTMGSVFQMEEGARDGGIGGFLKSTLGFVSNIPSALPLALNKDIREDISRKQWAYAYAQSGLSTMGVKPGGSESQFITDLSKTYMQKSSFLELDPMAVNESVIAASRYGLNMGDDSIHRRATERMAGIDVVGTARQFYASVGMSGQFGATGGNIMNVLPAIQTHGLAGQTMNREYYDMGQQAIGKYSNLRGSYMEAYREGVSDPQKLLKGTEYDDAIKMAIEIGKLSQTPDEVGVRLKDLSEYSKRRNLGWDIPTASADEIDKMDYESVRDLAKKADYFSAKMQRTEAQKGQYGSILESMGYGAQDAISMTRTFEGLDPMSMQQELMRTQSVASASGTLMNRWGASATQTEQLTRAMMSSGASALEMDSLSRGLAGDPHAYARAFTSQATNQFTDWKQINSDIGQFGPLAGVATGLPMFTTSGNIGLPGQGQGMSGEQVLKMLFGSGAMEMLGGVGQAFAGGANIPGTDMKFGGLMGVQSHIQNLQYQQQQQGMSTQRRSLEITQRYTPQIWALQDQMRDLGWAQTEYGFDQQERSMAMSDRHWRKNFSMSFEQSMMQRSWAREDWGYQDQQREMGWQWKQEDFAEESRFMSGRQRRKAEKDMRRATISHNLEGDSIERGRSRQEELWALEDERFATQKEQYEEQLAMQKENLAVQRAFFEERKRLELELTELQRKMWHENMNLQMESIKIQQHLQQEQMKAQMLQQAIAAYTLQLGIQQRNEVEVTGGALVNMLKRVQDYANGMFLFGGGGSAPGTGSNQPVTNGSGTIISSAYGNSIAAGEIQRVNDTPGLFGGEFFKPHVSGEIIPLFQFSDMAKMQGGVSQPAMQPVAVTINVGGQHLKTVIIDTVNAEIDL